MECAEWEDREEAVKGPRRVYAWCRVTHANWGGVIKSPWYWVVWASFPNEGDPLWFGPAPTAEAAEERARRCAGDGIPWEAEAAAAWHRQLAGVLQ